MIAMDATHVAYIAIAVGAASEIIAISPLRANSIIQLVLQFLRLAFPKR